MRIFFLLFPILLAPAAMAVSDTTIGNGGDVVRREGTEQYYLLDLFENGTAENPYFDERIQIPADIRDRVLAAFALDQEASELLAGKLAEITQRDKLLGYSLVRTLELLRWNFVSYPLKNVSDEGTVYEGALHQAAIRQGMTVYLQATLWAYMANPAQRAALALHELIYALYRPEALRGEQKVQRSYRVREINAYFFDVRWRDFNFDEFYRIVDKKLPTSGQSGFRLVKSADEFFLAPMLSLYGNIIYGDQGSKGYMGLQTKVAVEIQTRGRIDYFCQQFSSSRGLKLKSEPYDLVLEGLYVKLKRATYESPLGILDYINWSEMISGDLPPYDQSRTYFPRNTFGSWVEQLSREQIFDFTKQRYSPRVAQKAEAACLKFLNDGLSKFAHRLDAYQQ